MNDNRKWSLVITQRQRTGNSITGIMADSIEKKSTGREISYKIVLFWKLNKRSRDILVKFNIKTQIDI